MILVRTLILTFIGLTVAGVVVALAVFALIGFVDLIKLVF